MLRSRLSLFFNSIFLILIFNSCGSDESEPSGGPLSSQNAITEFTLQNVSGIIDRETNVISTILPEGTDVTALAPTIIISQNATISPSSGVAQDFSSPVTYTVTAENGDIETYTIFVDDLIFAFTINDTQYELVKEEMTWSEAAAFAVSRGGHLIEINDTEEQGMISNVLRNEAGIAFSTLTRNAVWMGGNDIAEEGNWILDGDNDGVGIQFWSGGVDGVAVNDLFNNWGREPDGDESQNALAILLEDTALNSAGQWLDLGEDSQPLFSLIEYD